MNDVHTTNPANGWGSARNAARFSIVAPHAGMLLMCVVRWVAGGEEETWASIIAGVIVIGLLVVGTIAGFVGLLWARGENGRETVAMSFLGLFLSGGGLIFCLATIWRIQFG